MTLSGSRRLWLVLSVLIMLVSLLVLGLSLWQTAKLRSQKAATTEFTLTLTRLAQWNVDVTNEAAAVSEYTGDSIARLLATGDVQSLVIERLLNAQTVGVFKLRGIELLSRWQQIRSEYARLNASAVETDQTTTGIGLQVAGLGSVVTSYEALFDAIISESLSRPLLKLASEIRAQLTSLEFVLSRGLVSEAQVLIDSLGKLALQLESIVRPANGPAILGYSSSLKLAGYLSALDRLELDDGEAVVSPGPLNNNTGLAAVTSDGLRFFRYTLVEMDKELAESQRNTLVASLLLSVCLLISALLVWIGRQSSLTEASVDKGILKAIQYDLSKLAEGDYSEQSSALKTIGAPAAITASYQRVVNAIASIRHLSRDKLNQTATLGLEQQQVIESVESGLAAMSEEYSERSNKITTQIDDLQRWVNTIYQHKNEAQADAEVIDAVNDTTSSLARLTTQLEECHGRVDRARSRIEALQSSMGRIVSDARQSSLQALNESIKLSDYYEDDSETEQFIQRMHQISNRLQQDADAALQGMGDMQNDIDACYMATAACLSAAEQGTRYTEDASLKIKQSTQDEASSESDIAHLKTLLASLSVEIQQSALIGKASLPEEDLLYLKGHALQLQLLAAEFSDFCSSDLSREQQA